MPLDLIGWQQIIAVGRRGADRSAGGGTGNTAIGTILPGHIAELVACIPEADLAAITRDNRVSGILEYVVVDTHPVAHAGVDTRIPDPAVVGMRLAKA